MKYKQMLDMNMVPEWRNQYLDYQGLDATLSKAIESKNMKSREKGVDLYFELIKFNQKFANHFSRQCQAQLDKINAFHKEKLSEMKGKYKNLQSQLDQVLSSAIYREIQPDLSTHYHHQVEDSDLNGATISSVSELFRNLKRKIGIGPQQQQQQQLAADNPQQTAATNSLYGEPPPQSSNQSSRYLSILPTARRLSAAAESSVSNLRAGRERMSMFARKLSDSFTNSAHRLSSNFGLSSADQAMPAKLNGVRGKAGTGRHLVDKYFYSNGANPPIEIQPTLAGANPQSKKKIIASYRKKISHLKFAFRELYFNLVLFEQYTQLNYTGFEQILRKHDRMFASTLGRKFYQEHVQTADFYNDLSTIDHLIESVEHIYTLHFENGNRRKAIEKLQVPTSVYKPSSPMLDFRVGYELGMLAVLFVCVLLIGFLIDTNYDWRTVFRLYRSPLLLIIFLFQSAISIVIWKHYKINHVLIFELNPRNNLSFHHFLEFGSLLGILWSLSVILFLFSERLGVRPSVCPLVVVFVIASFLFNPTATCHHRARFWLLRMLGRIFTAPLHPVRFADFWIADQLVSIVPLFLDLEYLSCFYTTGDVLSKSHLSAKYVNRCVTRNPQDLFIRTIVAALPAWFRCAQCLRRWHDENWLRLHLANAAKYFCMVSVVFLSSISQYNKSTFEFDTLRIIWMVAAIFTSCLTAYWDIIYDFGLFNTYDSDTDTEAEVPPQASSNKRSFNGSITSGESSREEFYPQAKKKKRYPFLRKELVYPVWVYYFAIVENWILRFGWIITISLTEFSGIDAGLVVSLLAPMEMFRRAVRDIPIEVVAPIDESHLDKVIMMMDSRDGPSMRNRLMKRRTLRPDRVSFIVLQPPDSSDSVTKRCDIRL